MGGGEKHFGVGGRFSAQRPLVPLPTISRKYSRVEHKLVGVIYHLLAGVWFRPGVGVHNCVVDLTPEDLNGVGRGVCLLEALVVCDPVRIGDDSIHCI